MPCGNWSSALRHLAADGILDGRAVVEGRVTLDDLSRSNEVAMLGVDSRPVAVLKRRGVAIDDVDPLAAEVDCLRWLAADTTTAAVGPRVVAAFDDIVVTAVAGATTLSEALLVADHEQQVRLMQGLGRSLAVLHAAEPDRDLLRPRRPWVLDLVDRRVPDTLAGDPGIEALVDRFNDHPILVAAVDRLGASWTTTHAIHGDIKFDNVVVNGGPLELVADPVLVDWELAGLGPAVWDLAGVAVGILVPRLLEGGVDDELDLGDVGRVLAPLLDAHHGSSDPLSPEFLASGMARWDATLVGATVVRMVQTSFQLCAMRHLDPIHEASSARVFDAALALADESALLDDEVLVS